MRSLRGILWFSFYLIVALSIGVFVRDVPGQPSLLSTVADFTNSNPKWFDPVSFLGGALDFYANKQFTPAYYWLIHLWPPGFMVLEGAILLVFGIDAPFILILIVLTALCIAVLLSALRQYLLTIVPNDWISIVPLLPFGFPVTRLVLLEPAAVTFGEGLAIVFFLLGFALSLLAISRRTLAIGAGVSFAFAAYFRSQFEPIVQALTGVAVVMLLYTAWRVLAKRKPRDRRPVIAIAIIVLTAQLGILPWKLHNLATVGTFTWVQLDLLYSNNGKTIKELQDVGATALVEGGANIACRVDPTYCGKADRAAYYRAFFTHLPQWYALKFSPTGMFWFSSLNSSTSPLPEGSVGALAADAVCLFFVVATLPLLWLVRRRDDAPVYFWIELSFYGCFFLIFTFIHFETRYFYLIKLFATFSFVLLVAAAYGARSRLPDEVRGSLALHE